MNSIHLTVFLLSVQFLFAQQNIPNGDFELWDTLDCTVPEDWSRLYCAFLGADHAVEMTSDSYSGKFAAQLNTVYIGIAGTAVPGTLISSSQCPVFPNECSGSPISERPEKLTGYYKYESIKNDSALIIVQTTFYDTLLESRVIVDTGSLFLHAASDYMLFNVPIQPFQTQLSPDSVLVVFYSFNPLSGESEGTLWIDDISLEFITQTIDISTEVGVYLYPNPANEYLFIECAQDERIERVTLYYANGSMGYQSTTSNDSYEIGISKLDPGMYIAVVELMQQVIIRKLVIL
ncbi:MAG TPA: T9SS type A sorting domain-containing protein [Saprospiraceae bacterium]|nr:T9SS type A sorting domain-containing protein [Saprospiraceae bacterium]